MEEVKKADVFGDTITEGKPVANNDITITLKRAYAIKLGKSVAKTKCDTLTDLVKAKDSLLFLKSLSNAGLTAQELELSADLTGFLDTYLS